MSGKIAQAALALDAVLAQGQTLSDPNGLSVHMTCNEAEAFADLFRALGLDHHAEDIISVHEQTDDRDDMHYTG